MEKKIFGLTYEQRNAQQIYNYIGVANSIKKDNINVYFFLKNYAFNKVLKLKLPPSDEKIINKKMKYFYEELEKSQWDIKKMKITEYKLFLENFYGKIDFHKADLNVLFLCKDLLEIAPLDPLGKKRMEYFNKRIQKFQIENQEKVENKKELKKVSTVKGNDDLSKNSQIKEKKSEENKKLKENIIEKLKIISNELDFHNIGIAKDHVEKIIIDLRKEIG